MRTLLTISLVSLVVLTGCGGSSTKPQANSGALSSNWQFTMSGPADNSFSGGLSGGFLLQTGSSVNGSVIYSISAPANPNNPCGAGSAPTTGTVNGQNVILTAAAGAQVFTLTGSLSTDGSSVSGTYTSTDGSGCGTAQTGLSWTAQAIKLLSGSFTGSFHSQGSLVFSGQDFPVSGTLMQSENIGASSATVTGSISAPGYPCFNQASLNGQISGQAVVLNLIPPDGTNAGGIGSPNNSAPAIFDITNNSIHGTGSSGIGYAVSTKACPQISGPGDSGYVCLQLGSSTVCTEPVLLSPNAVTFVPLSVGGGPVSQTITLTNQLTQTTINNLNVSLQSIPGSNSPGIGVPSDFNGQPNLSMGSSCGASLGPLQSCAIRVYFTPQQSCPWDPIDLSLGGSGIGPARCPYSLQAQVSVFFSGISNPVPDDNSTTFLATVGAFANSAVVASPAELDFGWPGLGTTFQPQPQTVTFTNQQQSAVTILPPTSQPCIFPPGSGTVVPGLQVIDVFDGPQPFGICDSDFITHQPNFVITQDNCMGAVLTPGSSCTTSIAFVPQEQFAPSNVFLEINTSGEIDGGRYPVAMTANNPSALTISPAAGFTFASQAVGTSSPSQTVTLSNTASVAVNFQNIVARGANGASGDYSQVNNCGASLAPGASCTITITFTPSAKGFRQGMVEIDNDAPPSQFQQFVQLRGIGH